MFFSKGYKEVQGKNIKASIESSISPLAMSIHISEGTSVEGDLSGLLNHDETAEQVKLTPSDEGEISEDNPVSLDIDMTNGGSAIAIEEITFATGNNSESEIDEGNIVIEYIDENGEEKELPVYFKNGTAGLSESDVIAALAENGNIHIWL